MRAAIQANLSFDPLTRHAHPDGLERAKACAIEGLCIFCEEALPGQDGPGRPRIICAKRGCKLAYFAAHKRDRYKALALTRTFRAIAENIEKIEGLGFTSGEPRAAAPKAFSDATRSAPEKESA